MHDSQRLLKLLTSTADELRNKAKELDKEAELLRIASGGEGETDESRI